MDRVFSAIKLVGGLAVVGAASLMQTAILLALLPSRTARIRSCIIYERLVGYSVSWLIGCRISIIGKENLNFRRPAIYVFNHTSIADLFITLRILPFGTVGVMKKEIVRYPFFGQVYLLTGHLRVDRSRQNLAISQMRSLGEFVRDRKLSIIMSAEGTRSKDGRLLPFKKGIAHMALLTGLPVVPVVVQGAHRIWEKNTLKIRGGAVQVKVLPAVDTSDWSADEPDSAVAEIRAAFLNNLPHDQLPLEQTELKKTA